MLNHTELREIFHFCFLERLLKISEINLYILKGGVNLRFFFNSPRYSEDMDIDVLQGNVSTLKKNGYKILNDESFKRKLKAYGIDDLLINDPSKAKHTDTTQRFRLRILTEAGEELPTKIEFSRRTKEEKIYSQCIEKINIEIARKYKCLSFLCQHYTGETALIQKIEALAGRTQVQSRDLFDIFILDLAGFGITKLSEIPPKLLKKAQENLLSISYKDFEGQVLEFLRPEEREQYSSQETFKEIQKRVMELISL